MSDKAPVDDLFGDEELGLGGPSERRRFREGRRGGPWLFVFIGAVLFIGLFWYLSAAQHDRYYLRVDDGTVYVDRGLFFPFGSSAWRPNRAYAPFALPPGVRPSRTGGMTAEQLDRTLLALFMNIAEREVADVNKGDPDRAEDMLLRANKLGHISVQDDRKLLEMLGDVAFRRGLTEIRGIQSDFDDALEQFQLAAMRGGSVYKGAGRWVESIRRLRNEFRELSVESGLDPDKVLARPPSKPKKTPVAAYRDADAGPDAGVRDAGADAAGQ